MPALAFSRTDLRRSMTLTSRSVAGTRGRIQGAVVVAEVALATVLLVGAGLLKPMSSLVTEQIASERYRARLIVVFAGLAALFSLMGVYGVTARSVAARTREMGIRLALGARRNSILGLVIGHAVRLSAAGALLGLLASLAATRGIEAYIWGVERTDVVTLATIAIGLAGASVLAVLAPGIRTARVDPVDALRDE